MSIGFSTRPVRSFVVTVAVVLTAAVLTACGSSGTSPAPSGSSRPTDVVVSPQGTPTSSITEPLQTPIAPPAPTKQPGVPVYVSIPRVHIASTLERLGLMKDGSLQQPTLFPRAGWYADGVRPGAIGPALIYGHIDSTAGPAVFWNLQFVRIGDRVDVRDDRGTTRHFIVERIQRFPKNHFPTQAVYGPTPFPVLRLATCTGAFDVAKRSYVDNLVVSAQLEAPIR